MGQVGDFTTYFKRDSSYFDPVLWHNNKKEVYKGYSYESKGIKNYGLGIRMREWDSGQTLYYHNGWWHGNTASFINLKKEKNF